MGNLFQELKRRKDQRAQSALIQELSNQYQTTLTPLILCNLFNLGRHLVSAKTYKLFRLRAFASWEKAAGI